MTEHHQQIVRSILAENRYMTLATTDGSRPWATTVEYVADDDLQLYFVSSTTSRHGHNIGAASPISVSIFDSTQPSMTGRGIQIDGTAHRLDGDDNPAHTIAGRADLPAKLPDLAPGIAAYRITPQRMYIPDPAQGGLQRTEVDLPSTIGK